MTELNIVPAQGDPKDKDYVPEKGTITNGMFAYSFLRTGDKKYQSEEREYSIRVVVDKKTAKAFKKAYPKNGCSEVDTADFEEKFKMAPPFPDEDEQFILKFAADVKLKSDVDAANLKAGDEVPYLWKSRPKALAKVDDKIVDVTFNDDYMIANGTIGHVAWNARPNSFGKFPKIESVLIVDLVKYEKATSESSSTGSAWGEVEGGYQAPEPSEPEAIGGEVEEAPAADAPAEAESEPENPFE